LEQAVERNLRELDLPFSNWTTTNFAAYLAQQTGIEIKTRPMENDLKGHRYRPRPLRQSRNLHHLSHRHCRFLIHPSSQHRLSQHPQAPLLIHR
jgi:hypothetical protein